MNIKPQRKVVGATAGAAIGELLAYGAVSGLGLTDFPTASLTIVCAFVVGWLIPDA